MPRRSCLKCGRLEPSHICDSHCPEGGYCNFTEMTRTDWSDLIDRTRTQNHDIASQRAKNLGKA